MKKKSEKEKDLQSLRETFQTTGNLFVTGYEKLTVQQDFELRKAVREAGGRYLVVKNTLAEKAAAGTPAESALKNLAGMTSVAFTKADPVALAKALTKYAKDNPSLTFKAGLVEGRAIDVGQIQILAAMPSREELAVKILFLINGQSQRLVAVLGGVARNLAVVINQGVQESKFSA